MILLPEWGRTTGAPTGCEASFGFPAVRPMGRCGEEREFHQPASPHPTIRGTINACDQARQGTPLVARVRPTSHPCVLRRREVDSQFLAPSQWHKPTTRKVPSTRAWPMSKDGRDKRHPWSRLLNRSRRREPYRGKSETEQPNMCTVRCHRRPWRVPREQTSLTEDLPCGRGCPALVVVEVYEIVTRRDGAEGKRRGGCLRE